MNKLILDQEEQVLLDAFEADEFESDLTDERKAYLSEAAEAVFKKDKRITIRISSRDLAVLQRRASLGRDLRRSYMKCLSYSRVMPFFHDR